MFSEDKVTEIFCLADWFCKFFHSANLQYGKWNDLLCPPQDWATIERSH